MQDPLEIARNALYVAQKALEQASRDDPDDAVVGPSDRPFGLTPGTFRAWCQVGRIKAFRGPRGRYQARLGDVRAALEANPVQPVAIVKKRKSEPEGGTPAPEPDAYGELIATGTVRRRS